jgi:hypothetical protein
VKTAGRRGVKEGMAQSRFNTQTVPGRRGSFSAETIELV